MIDFIQFDPLVEDHKKLAEETSDVIFEDSDGVIRFGWLTEKYHGNGYSTYLFVSNSESYNANYNYFALVNKIRK